MTPEREVRAEDFEDVEPGSQNALSIGRPLGSGLLE
jgi:hypothetical protein